MPVGEEGAKGCSATVNQSDTPSSAHTYYSSLELIMDRDWNDSQPIYRQLRDRVVAMILDGVLNEGDPLPSVRNVAAEYRVNPLTVLKGYQQLVDEQLVEKKRGRGMFINAGARDLLLQGERAEISCGRVAEDSRHDPTSRARARRTAARGAAVVRSARGALNMTETKPAPAIEARGLRKTFGKTVALDGVDLRIETGRIVGLIGPNGAGKTTALKAILGLTPYEGAAAACWAAIPISSATRSCRKSVSSPTSQCCRRGSRRRRRSTTSAGVHPRFDRTKAEGFLARTSIPLDSRVHKLSKGMITQLHLALVMAIDAKLLVLDEPTLGLDILYRKQFYDTLLNDYFDRTAARFS